MGGALARAVSKGKDELLLSDSNKKRAVELAKELGALACSNGCVAQNADVIFIAVKPAGVEELLCQIAPCCKDDVLIISMAAGVTLQALEGYAPGKGIIRIMPNTPACVGSGMITWVKNGLVGKAEEKIFTRVMSNAGILDEISESVMDAATAVAGCGPAFAYVFAQALADGGVQCGLARDRAVLYAAQMMKGAAEMILKTSKNPEQLKDEVCSPGGSTIVGVHALEQGGFRATVSEAVISAYEKTAKLGK